MTVRSIPARKVDYTAKSGVVCHCRSATGEHFLRYLELLYPAQQWAYEPTTFRDPAGGYLPDVRVLTDPVVWFEVQWKGFLDSWHDELAEAMRNGEGLRGHRPHDRIALMPWGFDWTEPMGPFL